MKKKAVHIKRSTMAPTVGRRYAIAAACLTSLFAVSTAFTSNGTITVCLVI